LRFSSLSLEGFFRSGRGAELSRMPARPLATCLPDGAGLVGADLAGDAGARLDACRPMGGLDGSGAVMVDLTLGGGVECAVVAERLSALPESLP
jgi:hypothetical protein